MRPNSTPPLPHGSGNDIYDISVPTAPAANPIYHQASEFGGSRARVPWVTLPCPRAEEASVSRQWVQMGRTSR